ncbi:MAG: hypothetical protein AAGF84_12405 [Planctomycetota bacterium]
MTRVPTRIVPFAKSLPALLAAAGLSLVFIAAPTPAAHGESGAHRTPPPPPAITVPAPADVR